MTVQVIEVTSQRGIEAFNKFPQKIYGDFYRAPLFPTLDCRSPLFDPVFCRVEAQPFLALKNGFTVGRVAACIHHAFPDGECGFFGYLEALQDPAVALSLVEAVSRWLAVRGRSRMSGPVDLSPHERLGLLAEGFGGRHHPGMPYNPPYYASLLERCGLDIELNLFAYHFSLRGNLPERLLRVAGRAGRDEGLKIRKINFNDLLREGEVFSEIHNGSMDKLWGFVPLAPGEGTAIWQKLREFYDPDLILIAEIAGKPAGLCLALCPVSRAPFLRNAWLNARLAVLAVLPRYRFKGLEAAMLLECAHRARRKGVNAVELSLVAENNSMMNRIVRGMEGIKRSRAYRIYQKYI